MALCSKAFSSPAKRSCQFNSQPQPSKKLCMNKLSSYVDSSLYSSSDDNDDSDDEHCYNQNQIKAKRRASSRISFCLDTKLSRAMSQYSDDDDDCADNIKLNSSNYNLHGSFNSINDENIDCKLISSPSNHNLNKLSDNLNSPPAVTHNLSYNALSNLHKIPDSDKSARSKCFEYLVGAIDEAWARYCDQATSVEDEVYGNGCNTPGSNVATDDEEFDNTTDITDYESDFEMHHVHKVFPAQPQQQTLRPRLASTSTTKEDPSSCRLQALKDRLTKAKYYLQDLVDSDDFNDTCNFWKRWDMIKYATIELVEDDDDDDIVESTIEELESGRYFIN